MLANFLTSIIARLLPILIFSLSYSSSQAQQNLESILPTCGTLGGGLPENGVTCGNSSKYWNQDLPHLPNRDAGTLKIRVNIIVCQRSDGSGNFQNNPTDLAFLNDWVNECNGVLTLWHETANCPTSLFPDTKVQIIPNFVFIQDDYAWNNDNGGHGPNFTNWWLNQTDNAIHSNPATANGLNVYLTVDGSVYHQFQAGLLELNLNNHTAPNYIDNLMEYKWYGPLASRQNLTQSVRTHCPNLYLKYLWFQALDQNLWPWSDTRYWLVSSGRTLAHELIHNMGQYHTDYCENIMHTNQTGYGLMEWQVGRMHQYLATSAMRQFVDCEDTYNNDGASFHTERIVSQNETWDLNMRVFSDVRVKSGATLNITCKLLMPENGVIHVERGAKLLVDGGEIWRANTCTPNQYWSRIGLHGNFTSAQPGGSTPIANLGGIVELKNGALIEGARVGISTFKAEEPWNSEYWGGKVISNQATFQDCRKGVEFMKYDKPNFSSFNKTKFVKTGTGTTHVGVSIWDTDGISFNETVFKQMQKYGIIGGDAVISMKNKCEVSNSMIGVHLDYTNPVPTGISKIGELGIPPAQRNQFADNTVGIEIFAGGMTDVLNNSFKDYDFDMSVAGNATTYSELNDFGANATGTQFDETGSYSNITNCNNYSTVLVGTNAQGLNKGLRFNHETYQANKHDAFIENNASSFGQVTTLLGLPSAGLQNSFTSGQGANIQHSTAAPWNPSQQFYYFYDDGNPAYKPECAQNDPTCGNPSGLWDVYPSSLPQPVYQCVKKMVECQEEACWQDTRRQIRDIRQLLDAGKSVSVLMAAQDHAPDAIQLLHNASPYLSDEVLLAVVHNPAISAAVKMDVLLANAPVANAIFREASNILSNTTIQPLVQVQEHQSISVRTQREHQLQTLVTAEVEIASNLLTNYMLNQNFDSAVRMLTSEADVLNQKRLFGIYLHQGNYDAAATVLESMADNEIEEADFKAVQTINLGRLRNNGLYTLSAAELDALETVIAHDRSERFAAQALLVQLTEAVYLPDMPNLSEGRPQSGERMEIKSAAKPQNVTLYPNPATDEVYFTFSDLTKQVAELTVHSMSTAKQVMLVHQKDIWANRIKLAQLPTGVYTIQIVFTDGSVDNAKLVIRR